MRSQEIHKSIREDIRDMKRIGRNIKHMKGKRGHVGVMYDPNRGLSEKRIKEKYDSKVVVYNMEKIMHKNEFKYLSDDIKILHLKSWRTRYSNKEIADEMGMAFSTFCTMLSRLGITDKNNKKPKITRKKDDLGITKTKGGMIGVPKSKEKDTQGEPKKEVEEVKKGINLDSFKNDQEDYKTFLSLNETTQGTKISSRLKAIAELVNDEEEYIVEVIIKRK